MMMRRTVKEVELGGYPLAPHTMVQISPLYTHRMEQWWNNPHQFDPDRFAFEVSNRGRVSGGRFGRLDRVASPDGPGREQLAFHPGMSRETLYATGGCRAGGRSRAGPASSGEDASPSRVSSAEDARARAQVTPRSSPKAWIRL